MKSTVLTNQTHELPFAATSNLRLFFFSFQFVMQTTLTKGCLLFLLLVATLCAHGQVSISGSVHEKNGTPIPYANVLLKETSSGTSTDSLGHFNFSTREVGPHIIAVSFVGFKTYEAEIIVDKSLRPLDIVLQVDQTTLGEVVISAGSFQASDKAKGSNMNPVDVVTTAGNNGDIANAIRALPGAQQVGEQAGLFVRGGASDETKQFIDGTLFKNPNYSSVPGILQPARVSPFLFKGINFSSGGYSALYGDALSGALVLESVDLPEKSSYLIGASPIVGTAGFQQLTKNNKLSYGVSSRYVNYAAYNKIIRQQPNYFKGPEYITVDGNFRWKTSKTGMLKLYTIYSNNNIGFINPDIDDATLNSGFEVDGKNAFGNLSYSEFLSDDWKIDLGLTYNFNVNKVDRKLLNSSNEQVYLPAFPYNAKNGNFDTQSHFANGKAVVTRFIGKHSIKFGGEQFYENDEYKIGDTLTRLIDNKSAVFAEADISLSPRMAARAGVRYEKSSLLDASNIAPRLSFAYRFDDGGQINLAYGNFYQKQDYLTLFQAQSVRSSGAELASQYKDLDFTSATHYVINYTRKVDNRLFRVEGYHKRYNKIVKTIPSLTNAGKGYAQGIELFFRDKKSIKNLDYWVTYTYLDTKRDYLNYPGSLRPTFSTPHTGSIAAKRFFEKINTSVNAAYYVATGRPYYNFNYTTDGNSEIVEQGKTNAYQSVNLSVAYLTTLFKNWKNKDFTVIAFGVNNLFGSTQVFGYNYSADGTNKMPITLPASRSFFAGIFMTFGINRTQDFINENL